MTTNNSRRRTSCSRRRPTIFFVIVIVIVIVGSIFFIIILTIFGRGKGRGERGSNYIRDFNLNALESDIIFLNIIKVLTKRDIISGSNGREFFGVGCLFNKLCNRNIALLLVIPLYLQSRGGKPRWLPLSRRHP